MRLAVVTTHPIQYHAPLYRALAASGRLDLRVFYTWEQAQAEAPFDRDFQRPLSWDLPLLSGYPYTFVRNVAREPGSHHFWGIDNPTLPAQLSAFAPDAILVYGWRLRGHLAVLRAFAGRAPLLFRGDSTLLDETGGPRGLLRRLALTAVYRHVDCALYAGTENRRYFQAHGLREEQLRFVPHAVDNRRFQEDEAGRCAEAARWRAELGIGAEEFVALFAGKLEPKKDPLGLLRAFLRGGPGGHLIFVGEGALRGALSEAARGAPGRVHLLGFQNQRRMPVVYRLADLFALPSRGPGETWGLGVNEAMACGRAVLVSDKVGCAVDLVRPGENGAIFRAGDEDHLATQLQALRAADRSAWAALGRRSREIIAGWSVEVAAEALIGAVYEVAARRW